MQVNHPLGTGEQFQVLIHGHGPGDARPLAMDHRQHMSLVPSTTRFHEEFWHLLTTTLRPPARLAHMHSEKPLASPHKQGHQIVEHREFVNKS